jgi:adenosylmethionine-8-amino-7-oxononanoate aminotransferase
VVLRRLRDGGLVEAARTKGELLLKSLVDALAESPIVGDVRGIGLMIGIELVRDRSEKTPFERRERTTERLVSAAFERGLLLYPSTGCVDGTLGDAVMVGPPFVVSEEEIGEIVERLRLAVEDVS